MTDPDDARQWDEMARHLVTDRDGPPLGHGPQFIRNYLHILRTCPRLRDALRDRFERHGLTWDALALWTAGECPAREDPHPPPARRPRQRWVADRRPSGSPAARLGGSR